MSTDPFSNGYNFMDATALLREMGGSGIRSRESLASHLSTPIAAEDILHSVPSDSLDRQDAYPLSEMNTHIDRVSEVRKAGTTMDTECLKQESDHNHTSISEICLGQIRREASPTPRRDCNNWQGPTILDTEFAGDIDRMELVAIAKYFTQYRSESELIWFLERFRARFPPESEWIWPLLDQFRQYQGKSVVVVLLQCPRHNDHITKPSDNPCFTHEIVNAIEDCFQPLDLGILKLDLRKQCRRTKDDKHCPGVGHGQESFVLGLCTAVEMLIATRVYGVKIHSTIVFSKSIASPGSGIDIIRGWDMCLMGTVYRVPWHPRVLYGKLSRTVAAQNAMLLLNTCLFPILKRISVIFQQSQAWVPGGIIFPVDQHVQMFLEYCRTNRCTSVQAVFTDSPAQTHLLEFFNTSWTIPSDPDVMAKFVNRTRRKLSASSHDGIITEGPLKEPLIYDTEAIVSFHQFDPLYGLSGIYTVEPQPFTDNHSTSASFETKGHTDSAPTLSIHTCKGRTASKRRPAVVDDTISAIFGLDKSDPPAPDSKEFELEQACIRKIMPMIPPELRCGTLDDETFLKLPLFLDSLLHLAWDSIGPWVEKMFPGTTGRFLELKLAQQSVANALVQGQLSSIAQNFDLQSTEEQRQAQREDLRLQVALMGSGSIKFLKQYEAQLRADWYARFIANKTPAELKSYRSRKKAIGKKVKENFSAAQWERRRETNRKAKDRWKAKPRSAAEIEADKAENAAYHRQYRAMLRAQQTPAERAAFLSKDAKRMREFRARKRLAKEASLTDDQGKELIECRDDALTIDVKAEVQAFTGNVLRN
ncbi:hypothetical protein FACUT_13921 [Fusarium acutatum]|uniref:Uncharacterized protein n=1 Tax=Fusarium acutatum TaxID=78861 RepID=A0A8H4NC21_9HYPO|nr:hypothetical protein FACUT_13921 [Fusarium acutatum]